jgi:cytochrome c2
MLKISAVLGVLGLGLLLLSVLPIPGLTPAAAMPTALPASVVASPPDAEYGRALFSAKGCVVCHHHSAVAEASTFDVGAPDLTHYPADPQFLRRWLADPKAIRPATRMPNLDLHQDEIEALITFLAVKQ